MARGKGSGKKSGTKPTTKARKERQKAKKRAGIAAERYERETGLSAPKDMNDR